MISPDVTLSGSDIVFCAVALIATGLFVLRVVLVSLGIDGFQTDLFDYEGGSGESSGDFRALSVDSVTAFFMVGGWVGLGAMHQLGLGELASTLVAFAAGAIAMLITALLVRLLGRMTDRGDLFSIQETVGLRGAVYQAIPAGGVGRVQLSSRGLIRELDAVSADRGPIPSFTAVTIRAVLDPRTVIVTATARN